MCHSVCWHMARIFLTTLAMVVFVLLFLETQAQGQATDWKTRFVKDLKPAWETYAKKIAHLQGNIRVKHYKDGPDGTLNYEQEVKLRQRAGHEYVLEQDVKVESNPDSLEAGVLWAVNPDYGFEIRRTSPNRPWLLKQIDFPAGKQTKINPSELIGAWFSRPASLMTVYARLPSTFTDAGFKYLSFKEVEQDQQRAVRIDFTYTPDGKNPTIPMVKGYSILFPEKYWIANEHHARMNWSVRPGLKQTVAVKFDYADLSAEVPILKRVEQENRVREGSKESVFFLQTDFDLFEGNVAAEEEYRLSGYGLPEPVGVTWSKPTPVYVWILCAALACAALAFGFRFLARRQQSITANEGEK